MAFYPQTNGGGNESGHPDRRLTLRQAYERHYDAEELSPRSIEGIRNVLTIWERFAGELPVSAITDETMAGFRRWALERVQPATVNRYWRVLRALLRRIGPRAAGNYRGLGIVPVVPYMKPCRAERKLPRRIPIEEIGWAYAAATRRKTPNCGFPAPLFWQTLIVLLYTAGLRISDALRLRRDQFDLAGGTLDFTASKTGKSEEGWPLHPIAVEHVRRIWLPERALLLPVYGTRSGMVHVHWRDLMDDAGVERKWGFHDLRRTGASECDRVRPGTARLFLQHAPQDVTGMSYLNKLDELREAICGMRIPEVFTVPADAVAATEHRLWLEAQRQRQALLDGIPSGTSPDDWEIRPGMFRYRDLPWCRLQRPTGQRLLDAMVNAGRPLRRSEIIEAVYAEHTPRTRKNPRHSVLYVIEWLRKTLRLYFGVGGGFDPVPCVYGSRIDPSWTLNIPPHCQGSELDAKGGAA